jgi:hypothetical protein
VVLRLLFVHYKSDSLIQLVHSQPFSFILPPSEVVFRGSMAFQPQETSSGSAAARSPFGNSITMAESSRPTAQGARRGRSAQRERGRGNEPTRSNPQTPHRPSSAQSQRSQRSQRFQRSNGPTRENFNAVQDLVLSLRTALKANPVRPPPVIPSVERPTEAPTPLVTSSAVPTDPKHFIKLPNPETLSNGISPTFKNWENKALNKLKCNSWLFSDERTRFAWLTSLVSGDVRLILAPHIDRKNSRAFTTTQEVFNLFRQLYNNPNQQGAAKKCFNHSLNAYY